MPDSREEILLRELEKLRRENENLRSHEQKAQEKLTELKAENEQLESQNKLLETERKKLESVNQKLESVNQKLESDNQNLQAAKQILESKNQKLKDFPQDTVERIYDVYRYSAFTCFKLTDPKNIPDTKEAEPFIRWHLTNLAELIAAYAILKKKELENFELNKGAHISLSAARDISGTGYDSVMPAKSDTAPDTDGAVCESEDDTLSDDNVNAPELTAENLSAEDVIAVKQERLSASLLRTTARLTELETQKKNAETNQEEQEPVTEPEAQEGSAAEDKFAAAEDGTDGTDTVSWEIELIKTHGAQDGSSNDFKSKNRKNTKKGSNLNAAASLDRKHITHIRPKKLEVFCPHCHKTVEITCVIKDYEHNVKQSLELLTRIASIHAVVGKCPDCGTLLTVHPEADNLEVTIEESRKSRESNNAPSIDGKPFNGTKSQSGHGDFVTRPLPAPPPVYGIKDFDYAKAGTVQTYSGGDLLIGNVIQVIIYQYLWNCPYNRVLELLNIGSHDAFFTSLLTLGRNCFKPLAELIKDEILSYPVVHADESYMRVLYGASGNKNHSNSYVWQIALPLYTGNYLNYYRIYPGRGREYAERLLSSDNKIKVTGIVTDCYGVYDGIAKERGYKHALCWAHLRKYLINAMDNAGSRSIYENLLNAYGYNGMADGIAKWYETECQNTTEPGAKKRLALHRDAMLMLLGINHLFALERNLDPHAPDYLNTVKNIRDKNGSQLFNVVKECAKRLALDSCTIGLSKDKKKVYKLINTKPYSQPAAYFLNGINGFKAFLSDARFPLSQARVETSFKNVALQRATKCFINTDWGMRVYGDLLSITDSCRQQQVDVGRYLIWAISNMYKRFKRRYPHKKVRALDRWEYLPYESFTQDELKKDYVNHQVKIIDGQAYLRVNQYDRHIKNDFDAIDVKDLSIKNYIKQCGES